MDRWTMNDLKNTDEILFAIAILNERKKGLNPYSPLSQKISEAANYLETIRQEKERFISRITFVGTEAGEPEQKTDSQINPGFIKSGALLPEPDRGAEHTTPFGGNYWDIIYAGEEGQKIPARDMPDTELERIGRMVSEGFSCGEIFSGEDGLCDI